MATSNDHSLTRSTGRALRWNYLGMITRMGLGFGTNVLLTRLLGPGPFGELAVAMLVFSFGNLIADVGLGTALIQKHNLEEGDIRFCFTCQVVIGGLMSLLLILTAPAWAVFFHAPHLAAVLRVFSLLFLFQAFGITANSLLMRAHNAKAMQTASITSYLIGYVGVGVPMALLGKGVWSLVAAWLVQALLGSIISYSNVRHSIVPLLHRRHASLLTFGLPLLAAYICNWGIANLDNTMVGRFFGPVPLGLYNRAFSFTTIGDSLTSSLMQVLLPSMSRVQSDLHKLRQVYVCVLGLLVMFLAPPFAAMAAVPAAVILGLFGHNWAGSIWLFQPIALCIPINAALSLAGPLLTARGRPEKEFYTQLIAVVVAAAAFFTAVHYSVLVLSWVVLCVYFLRFLLLTQASNNEINGRWSEIFATAWPGLVLAALAATLAKGLDTIIPAFPEITRLILILTGAGAGTGLSLLVFSHTLLRPIFSRSPQLVTLVPSAGRRFLPSELQ